MIESTEKCVPDRCRGPLRTGASFLAVGFLALASACGGGGGNLEQLQHEQLMAQVRSNYLASIVRSRANYVIITYPKTQEALPAEKREELDLVRSVLVEQKLPFDLRKRDDIVETITVGGKNKGEHQAYRVPDSIAERCRGGTILILNLDVRQDVRVVQHPKTAEYDLTLLAWNDPIKLGKKRPSM